MISIFLSGRRVNPIRLLTGRSSQELLWETELGRPVLKTEKFEFLMMMSDGRTQEFTGLGRTTYRYTERLDRRETVRTLESELKDLPGLNVEPTDEGILLTMKETDRIPVSARFGRYFGGAADQVEQTGPHIGKLCRPGYSDNGAYRSLRDG